MEKKRILIVDDELELIKVLTARLVLANYEVIAAYDGKEALLKARTEKPDLIILDIMLPIMDGYKVCAMLKNDNAFKNIPIIILSARVLPQDQEKGHKVGADAYITKPFTAENLLNEVNRLLVENK